MPLDLSSTQLSNLQQPATRPIYLIEHEFSGVLQRVSCSGQIVYDGFLYEAGGANVKSIKDAQAATVELFASPDNISYVETGAWRQGALRIIFIPGVPLEADYNYSKDEGFLVIDGEIVAPVYDGKEKITLAVTHVNNLNKISPRHTWDEISRYCPPAGTELVWEGGRYLLQPRPTTASKPATFNPNGINGNISASTVKALSQPLENITVTSTGANSPIKILLGRTTVAGDIIALGSISGDLVIAVGWGYGELEEIEKVFINDTEILTGGTPGTDLTFTSYTGKFNQSPDPTLVTAIAAFSSPFILSTPNGTIGTAYTVFRIPAGEISGAPTFRAIVKGVGVYDPRLVGENDTHWQDDVFAISFADPVDTSPNQLPYTLEGTITLSALRLVCSGAGYLHIPYDASMVVGASIIFDAQIRFTVGAIGSLQWLCSSATNAGQTNKSWAVAISATGQLLMYVSSNGATWDLVNAAVIRSGLQPGDAHVLGITRIDTANILGFVLDGVGTIVTSTASAFYNDGASGIVLGARSDNVTADNYYTGSIDYFRATVGSYRPALSAGGLIGGLPFPEYEQYTDTTILCAAHLARHPVYGMGVNVSGLENAADYNEELLDGSFPRCTLGIAISSPQATANYLDLLVGEYGECFWYNQGRDIHVTANSIVGIDNPHGATVVTDADFTAATDWTIGADNGATTIAGGLTVDGSQLADFTVEQTLSVDAGARYVLSIDVAAVTAGTYSVNCEGVGDISASAAVGKQKVIIVPSSDAITLTLQIYTDSVLSVASLDLVRLYWGEHSIVANSLKVNGVEENDSPTSVTTKYTEPSSTNPNWAATLGDAVRRIGVDSGDIPAVDTTLYMEGVTRVVEANNKSNAKMHRYDNRVKYTWKTTDVGVRHRKGDVVQLTRPLHGINAVARITSAEMVEYGRYKVTAMRYSEDQYPSEVILPVGTGIVPVGVITLMEGAVVPDGWDLYTEANGAYILGAGGAYVIGDEGGAATFAGWSGNTDAKDMHGEGFVSLMPTQTDAIRFKSGLQSAANYINTAPNTTHAHSYSTGTINPNLLRRRSRLMIKTGSAATKLPKEALVFGLANIVAAGVGRITAYAGRLLEAANAQGNAGASSVGINLTTNTLDMSHTHYAYRGNLTNREVDEDAYPPPGNYYYTYAYTGTTHNHAISKALARNVKKIALPLFGSNNEYDVVPGMYFLWAGAIGSLPADFVLADGTNSTHDCRDYFIEIAQLGSEGATSGDNTLALQANTNTKYHNHKGAQNGSTTRKFGALHSENSGHFHAVNRVDAWMPPYYALAVIMYAPA